MFQQLNSIVRRAFGVMVIVTLAGCGATNNRTSVGPIAVGPGSGSDAALGQSKKVYKYNSDIFLDVAIPVFNPGFPLLTDGSVDYDAIDKQKIWPQLRVTEAKKFAVEVKEKLQDTKSFGTVNVVPTPNTSADLFVLGTILESNGEEVAVRATVIDSTGDVWGTKVLKQTVSPGFFRDYRNKGKDPYDRVYKQVADYVYDLVVKVKDKQKNDIKTMTEVRYAQTYSPESYGSYTTSYVTKRHNMEFVKHKLAMTPPADDPMMKRIAVIRNHDLMFVDRLQEQYEAFDAKTDEPYHEWQTVALPETIAAREAQSKQTISSILSVAAIVGAAMLDKNSNSNTGKIGKYVLGAAGVYAGAQAMEANSELKAHKETLDELGNEHDMKLTPSVMEIDNQTYELSGTASEQYDQWKARLKQIYELENSSASF